MIERVGSGPGTGSRTSATVPRGSRFLRVLLVGLDALGLTLAWALAAVLGPTETQSIPAVILSSVILVLGGLVAFSAMGLYRARVCSLRATEYEHLIRSCVVVALVALAFAAVTSSIVRPREIVLGSVLAFLFTAVLRSGYRAWLTNRRRAGEYLRPVLLVGGGAESAGIAALLGEHSDLGYFLAGVIGPEGEARRHGLAASWCGDLDDALPVLAKTGATGAIICASDLDSSALNRVVRLLVDAGKHVQLSSGLHGVDIGRLRPSPIAYEPLFYIERVSLAWWQLFTKRVIDLLVSSIMLILVLPVLALAALGIKLQDWGPVLFRQQRIGRHGAPFVLYKLRTMREGAEEETHELVNMRDGPLSKFPGDPRVTRLGRVLRATSIDELPQLWNVLNGTMSLVGPRPALPDEVASFDAELRARESVRPGITGLWQVEGRDNPSFAAYRRFDLFYVQNWSVALDLMILVGTVESVIARVFRGLSHLDREAQIAPLESRRPGQVVSRSKRRSRGKAVGSATSASKKKKKKAAGVR